MKNVQVPAVPETGEFQSKEDPRIPLFKDAAILSGWIAALILIAGLCWFFTQPLRSRSLLRAVNHVLEESGDHRRLMGPLSTKTSNNGFQGTGIWYTILEDIGTVSFSEGRISGARAFVFVFIGEGCFFPCAAIVTAEGKAQDFIPLNNYGKRMMKRISPAILSVYARRIEGIK